MRDAGIVEPLSRELFRLASLEPLGNPDLVTVAARVPHGVICLIAALAYHELTTQVPHAIATGSGLMWCSRPSVSGGKDGRRSWMSFCGMPDCAG